MIPLVTSWFLYVTHLLKKQSHTLKEVFLIRLNMLNYLYLSSKRKIKYSQQNEIHNW